MMTLYCTVNCQFARADETAGDMTRCCVCKVWLHDKCIGLDVKKKVALPFYACSDCSDKLGALVSGSAIVHDSARITTMEQTVIELQVRVDRLSTVVSDLTNTVNDIKASHSDVISKLVHKSYRVEADVDKRLDTVEGQLAAVACELNECGAESAATLSSAGKPSSSGSHEANVDINSVTGLPPLSSTEEPWTEVQSKNKKKRSPKKSPPPKKTNETPSANPLASVAAFVTSEFMTPTRNKKALVTHSAKGSAVVIGDSTIRHTREYTTDKGMTTICVPGGRIGDIIEVVQTLPKILPSPPEKIILHVGTNNWGNWESSESIASKMKELISVCRIVQPSAKILVSGILLRRDSNDCEIKHVNDAIYSVVKKCANVYFVDSSIRHSTKSWLGKDGLHLNRFGIKMLAEVFVNPYPKNW